jgi:circadian clock protein KaiB
MDQAPAGRSEADEDPLSANSALYVLRLYVTGKTPKSQRAVASVKEVCERYLPGQYHLQVIDIYQQPALAEGDRIIVAPTLVKKSPQPARRVIGDLSDRNRILTGLDLQPED